MLHHLHRLAALLARRSGAAIHAGLRLEGAGIAIDLDKIAQGAAAQRNRAGQHFHNRRMQAPRLGSRGFVGGFGGRNTGQKSTSLA